MYIFALSDKAVLLKPLFPPTNDFLINLNSMAKHPFFRNRSSLLAGFGLKKLGDILSFDFNHNL